MDPYYDINYLINEWNQLISKLNLLNSVELLSSTFTDIASRYTEAHRAYHTLQHIEECLKNLNQYLNQNNSDFPGINELELAIWYHDIIYDPRSKTNEEDSKNVFENHFKQYLPQAQLDIVSQLILQTQDHNDDDHLLRNQLMIDIDLAILGSKPDRFWQYEDQIRSEYSFVPLEIYQEKRSEIMESFLSRDNIYHLDYFRTTLEKQARTNLRSLFLSYDN